MSAQLIKDVSDVAAYRAAEEGRVPLSIWGKRDATHIPFLGDYTPEGWRRALWSDFYTTPRVGWPWREDEEATFMVDTSGFGAPDEPALTIGEFQTFVTTPQRPQNDYGWAIRESGQFQIVVGAYIADPESKGNPAPSEDDVTCEDCGTVHDGMEECDEDGLRQMCSHENTETEDEADGVAFGAAVHHDVTRCLDCGAELQDVGPDEDGHVIWEVVD
jgi:hypothetical protein